MPTPEQVSFSVLTAALAKELGFPDAVSDEDDYFYFEKEAIPVTIFRKGAKVMLYSSVGAMPTEAAAKAVLSAVLLNANALYRETGEAVLGVPVEDNIVTLCWLAPLDGLPEGDFLRSVENFLTLATYWTGRIAEFVPAAEGETLALAPAPPKVPAGIPGFAGIPDFA
jgi:hypothetical protein